MTRKMLFAEECGSVIQGRSDGVGSWQSALRHVFAAATSASNFREYVFHQLAHVVGLACGLRQDERGLRRSRGEQSDRIGTKTGQLLREELQEIHVAIAEGADHKLASIR